MKFGVLFISLLSLGASNGILNAAESQQHTVDLSKSDNLKAFFDAGLRPWRLPASEESDCILKNENLHIILPGNLSYHLHGELIDIFVLAGNQLGHFDVFEPSMPMKNAVDEMRGICSDLGIATSGLDDFLAGKNGISWGGEKTASGVYVQVIVQSVPSVSGPTGQITSDVIWRRPGVAMNFNTTPIQPPPGYENVSMDPPPRKPNQRQLPEHNAQYYQDQLQQRLAGRSSDNSSTPDNSNATSSHSSQSPTNSPSTTTQSGATSNSWLTPKYGWWVLLGLLVLLFGAYALKRNK